MCHLLVSLMGLPPMLVKPSCLKKDKGFHCMCIKRTQLAGSTILRVWLTSFWLACG